MLKMVAAVAICLAWIGIQFYYHQTNPLQPPISADRNFVIFRIPQRNTDIISQNEMLVREMSILLEQDALGITHYMYQLLRPC